MNYKILDMYKFKLKIKFLIILVGTIISLNIYGETNSLKRNLDDLELLVFNSKESKLDDLEVKIVKIIQTRKNTARMFQIYSILLKRIYETNPINITFLNKALAAAQQALELDIKSPYGYVAMVEILDYMGKTQHAKKLLKKARLNVSTPNWRLYFVEANLYNAVDTKKSSILYNLAMNFNNANKDIISPYLVALYKNKLSERLFKVKLLELDKKFNNYHFKEALAQIYYNSNEYRDALTLYKQILIQKPDLTTAKLNLAITYAMLPRYEKKAQIILKKLELNKNLSNLDNSLVLLNIAKINLKSKLYKKAHSYFVKGIVADVDNIEDNIVFVVSAYKNANKNLLLEGLLKDLAIKAPGHAKMYSELGLYYKNYKKKPDLAINYFDSAIALSPGEANNYINKGLSLYDLKDFEKALFEFKQASSINPDDSIALYNQACMNAILKNNTIALMLLKNAISLDKKLAKQAKFDPDLKNLYKLKDFEAVVKTN